jgi:hypothetical protein
VRPVRRLLAHRGAESRWFEVGEEIPEDWEPWISNRSALDVFPLRVSREDSAAL